MTGYIKRTESSQRNNLMLHHTLRTTRTTQTQIKQKERNIKIKAKMNEIETKKTYKESTKNKLVL
jgi:hypothetical protein